jgi:hypothetical protein
MTPFWRSPAIKVVVRQCPCGNRTHQPLAARGSAVAPGHFGIEPGLVEKDKAGSKVMSALSATSARSIASCRPRTGRRWPP